MINRDIPHAKAKYNRDTETAPDPSHFRSPQNIWLYNRTGIILSKI